MDRNKSYLFVSNCILTPVLTDGPHLSGLVGGTRGARLPLSLFFLLMSFTPASREVDRLARERPGAQKEGRTEEESHQKEMAQSSNVRDDRSLDIHVNGGCQSEDSWKQLLEVAIIYEEVSSSFPMLLLFRRRRRGRRECTHDSESRSSRRATDTRKTSSMAMNGGTWARFIVQGRRGRRGNGLGQDGEARGGVG